MHCTVKLNTIHQGKSDILFVGLNPAKGSSDNLHYFSINQAFWNRLYDAGLIIARVDNSLQTKLCLEAM